MKYLEKSFSVSMHIPRKRGLLRRESQNPDLRDKPHIFVNLGGMCQHCALDRRGHDVKQERLQK